MSGSSLGRLLGSFKSRFKSTIIESSAEVNLTGDLLDSSSVFLPYLTVLLDEQAETKISIIIGKEIKIVLGRSLFNFNLNIFSGLYFVSRFLIFV
jgi:hypothetical protein